MYCVKCGVHLADTEKKCPLCNTVVYHPEVTQGNARELYPKSKMPRSGAGRAFVCGAVLFLFMIPLVVTFFADIYPEGVIDWFGYVAGGVTLAYLIIALPMWFKRPNPVIFVPCDFVACALYLFYINHATSGNWFFTFALPIIAGLAIVITALVTLLRYLRRGKLYVVGAAVIAFGALTLLVEYMMSITFDIAFIGWSYFPLLALFLFGDLLIYLAINSVAREKVERKIFF